MSHDKFSPGCDDCTVLGQVPRRAEIQIYLTQYQYWAIPEK